MKYYERAEAALCAAFRGEALAPDGVHRIVGIDPGIVGAVSVLICRGDPGRLSILKCLSYQFNSGEFNLPLHISDIARSSLIVIERQRPVKGDTPLTGFSMGAAYGELLAWLHAARQACARTQFFPHAIFVAPETWQRDVWFAAKSPTAVSTKVRTRNAVLALSSSEGWPTYGMTNTKERKLSHHQYDSIGIAAYGVLNYDRIIRAAPGDSA